MTDAVRLVVREEGVGGLYKGLSPTLIALVPNWAVSIRHRISLVIRMG